MRLAALVAVGLMLSLTFVLCGLFAADGLAPHPFGAKEGTIRGPVDKATATATTTTSSVGLGPVLSPIIGNHVRKSLPPGEHRVTGDCIVSDRMRLIFVKTAKSAGSTVLLGWIRPSLCPPKNASDVFSGWGASKQLGNAFSKSCDETIVFPRPGNDSAPCASVPKWKWRQYFVITTIRNPYSRMRSCFTHRKPALAWGEFCEDPQSSGDICRGAPKWHGHAFNVHYQFPVHWAYHSWWGWHIDYAIRTEAMAAGIAEVAAIVNTRAVARGEPLRLMGKSVSVNVQHKTTFNTAEKELCAWYSGEHAHCAAALERMLDPTVLGYADYCAATARQRRLAPVDVAFGRTQDFAAPL